MDLYVKLKAINLNEEANLLHRLKDLDKTSTL